MFHAYFMFGYQTDYNTHQKNGTQKLGNQITTCLNFNSTVWNQDAGGLATPESGSTTSLVVAGDGAASSLLVAL